MGKYIFSSENINLKNKEEFLKTKQNILGNPYLQISNYKITKKSKENYCYYTNVLRRMLKHEFPELDEEEQFCKLLDFNMTNKLLEKHFAENHSGIFKNLFIFLCKFFNTPQHQKIHDLYSEKMNFINENYFRKRNQNEKSEKELKNWVSFEEIENYLSEREEWSHVFETKLEQEKKDLNPKFKNINYERRRKQYEKKFQETIILASYVLCPPVRNDWYGVKLKNMNKEKDNYLVFDKKEDAAQLILNDYKTQKIYGKLEIPLTEKFTNLIKKFLRIKKENEVGLWEDDSEYLFQSTYKKRNSSEKNDKNISGSDFSKFLTRILKKKFPEKQINIQMIRKIYTTSSRNFESVEKAKEIAKVMGHSYKEHLLYFKTKTSDEIEKEIEKKQIRTDVQVLQYLNLEENKYRFQYHLEKEEWWLDNQ